MWNKERIMVASAILLIVLGAYFLMAKNKKTGYSPGEIEKENLLPTPLGNLHECSGKDSLPLFVTSRDQFLDPFSKKSSKKKSLEEALDIKEKEIRLLKAQIEELKLKREVAKLKGNSLSSTFSSNDLRLIGIASVGGRKKIYLSLGGKKLWLGEGEGYGNAYVEGIKEKSATLTVNQQRITLEIEHEMDATSTGPENEDRENPQREGEETK